MLCLFNISHFSSTVCSEAMAKRSQQDSGEKRVTAKSKPMMNLVSRCSERTPSQEWKTDTEMYERSGRSDETSWRATREIRLGFSHEETYHDGTAQSVVNEVMPRDRQGKPISILKKGHVLNNSSLETMNQNKNCQ